jgi:ADP-ribose pyrophosphatase YjhB (NUDIX family)
VSVKGVVIRGGKVILVRNGRDEWELPGGKLELSESPKECLAREIAEELQLVVEPKSMIDAWTYTITPGVHVLVLSYGCIESSQGEAVLSDSTRSCGGSLAEVDTWSAGWLGSIGSGRAGSSG